MRYGQRLNQLDYHHATDVVARYHHHHGHNQYALIGKMKNKRIWTILLGAATVFLVMSNQIKARGTESAPYQVVRTDGKFELRDYPALMVVEAAKGTNADSNFRRLFRFIRGGNEAQQKIAMTTPVLMSGNETNETMAFVMPADLKRSQVPNPTDSGLVVKEMAAGQFAVFSFRGGRKAQNEAAALIKLNAWMKLQNLNEQSPSIYGYFNAPWIPGWFRHNEVMIRVGSQ